MVTIETMKDILYDDAHGLFVKIRDHKFDALNREVMDQILEFTRALNEAIKQKTADPKGIAMVIDLLNTIHSIDGAPDNKGYMEQYFDAYNDFFNEVVYELTKGI